MRQKKHLKLSVIRKVGDEKIYTEMNIDKLLDLINKSENIEVSGAIYYVGEHVEINISVKEPTDEIIGKIVELARAIVTGKQIGRAHV